MKNLLKSYLEGLLSNSKAYRRRKGGAWYCVVIGDDVSGFAGSTSIWIPAAEWKGDTEILDRENN